MRSAIPRKRAILAFHRWLGAMVAFFILVLAITGLALNHSKALGLDDLRVKSALILKQYGMASAADIVSYRIHDLDTISYLQGQLYFNGVSVGQTAQIVGIFEGKGVSLVACRKQIVILTREGELVEIIDAFRLPFDRVNSLGETEEGAPVLVTDRGSWRLDADWVNVEPLDAEYAVKPPESIPTPENVVKSILSDYQGSGPTLSKVLLDIHTGRLLGWGGRTVMDVAAAAMILLVLTGVSGWLRKSRRKTS